MPTHPLCSNEQCAVAKSGGDRSKINLAQLAYGSPNKCGACDIVKEMLKEAATQNTHPDQARSYLVDLGDAQIEALETERECNRAKGEGSKTSHF